MNATAYTYVKREVLNLTGIDLNHYKTKQVQRRLSSYLLRSQYDSWPGFFRALRDDPHALTEFKNYLTIVVSSFFRDPQKYEYLQQTILPALLHDRPALKIWSAGASRGQEPYSLAILLTEARGQASLAKGDHTILATDINPAALAIGRAGGPYSEDDLANVAPALRRRYFRAEGEVYYVDGLREYVQFRRHNLLTEPPDGNFDLIVCRNVVIYFTASVKEELYRRFYDVLRPGGILFVGGTEVISNAAAIGFETAGISFYRKRNVRGGLP